MKMWDLDNLVRDQNQDDLYDLFAQTFKNQPDYQFEVYVVGKEEEMRIDLISQKLYGNVDQVPFLLNFNQISNPLNIKENDVIRYCNLDVIDVFNESPQDKDIAPKIVGTNKSTRKDPNRQKFVENDFALPPNLLEAPQSSINIVGNKLVIGT
jgi:hypothetical protein